MLTPSCSIIDWIPRRSSHRAVYEGPLKQPVKLVKIFSLTTCTASLVGVPLLVYFGKEGVPLVAKLGMVSIVGIIGIGSTFLLHWLTKGYVRKMDYDEETDRVRIETLSILARPIHSEVNVADVRPVEGRKVFSNFQVNNRGYFIHPEVFEHRKLLARLLHVVDYSDEDGDS